MIDATSPTRCLPLKRPLMNGSISRQPLPQGPLALARWETSITDETDAGPETIAVVIDETLDCTGLQIPALMRLARAQWAALTWLCWAVGRSEVQLPGKIEPPPEFSAAVVAGITRAMAAGGCPGSSGAPSTAGPMGS